MTASNLSPAAVPRQPGTAARVLLFVAAASGAAALVYAGLPPGARDRLPVLAIALLLALAAARRRQQAIVAFAFLFPFSGLLARLFGGTEPLAWPLILFAGLAAGWSFRFIYDFENPPDPSRWDALLRALTAVWILSAALAVARARTLWAIAQGLTGRAVNGAGLLDSTATRESLLALAVLLSGSAFFFLLRRAGPAVRRRALHASLAGVGVSALAAILQRAGVLPGEAHSFWKITGRLSGGAMDPNALGLLCAMAVTVIAVVLLRGGARRGLLLGAFILFAGGLLLSGSRSGLLVPLCGLPAVLLLRRRDALVPAAALALGGTAVVLAILWIAPPRPGTLPGRLAQTFDPSLPLQYRISERPVLWRSAVRLFRRSPIEGAGLGAFSWSLPDLLREEKSVLPMRDNPGSAYVQALAETGLVGFALTVVLALSLARQSAIRVASADTNALVVGSAAAALGFLVAQLLGSHWLAPDVCLFFFLLASLVALPRIPPRNRLGRALLIGAVLLYAAGSVAAAAATARASATFRHDSLAGFHPLETGLGGPVRWTRRRFAVGLKPGESVLLRLAHFPPDDQPVVVASHVGSAVPWRRTLQPGESVLLRLTAPAHSPRAVRFLLSRTFVPKRLGISGDRRELGVQAVIPAS
jgi:O-antigen ligase